MGGVSSPGPTKWRRDHNAYHSTPHSRNGYQRTPHHAMLLTAPLTLTMVANVLLTNAMLLTAPLTYVMLYHSLTYVMVQPCMATKC